jgi:arginyl-tRNA synthetase
VITRDLRRAIAGAVAAAGFDPAADPGLRPAGTPGRYAASIALTLGPRPRAVAAALAGTLAHADWIAAAEVTGPGYLTVTVTPAALAAVADAVTAAGPGCVISDALAGLAVAAPPQGNPLDAATWDEARAALAAVLTARLAAAAGATLSPFPDPERERLTPSPNSDSRSRVSRPGLGAPEARPDVKPADARQGRLTPSANPTSGTGVSRPRSGNLAAGPDAEPRGPETERAATAEPHSPEAGQTEAGQPEAGQTEAGRHAEARRPAADVAAAVAFAGRDAVVFSLARAIPGKPVRMDRQIIARQVAGNPAYAVRYAHARAASGVRWAATSSAAAVPGTEAAPWCPPADPGVLALLDALSWLPERVATAARRSRPDEFARYLEDLASVTVDVLSSASHPGNAGAPGSDRLAEARAARAGLAAGLGLLGVSAPERL